MLVSHQLRRRNDLRTAPVARWRLRHFMKGVADAETRRILGAATPGMSGDEAIHGLLDMMSADEAIEKFRRAVPIHPPCRN
jgi:pyruvate/2-oxoglutarate dehydrogenase complex dihydrolipoamide dehydrogenase (E3) component